MFGLVPDHDSPLSIPCDGAFDGENVDIAPNNTILALSGTILTACDLICMVAGVHKSKNRAWMTDLCGMKDCDWFRHI